MPRSADVSFSDPYLVPFPPEGGDRFAADSEAELPAQLEVSKRRLKKVAPVEFGWGRVLTRWVMRSLREDPFEMRLRLWYGEAEPAFIMSYAPLRVAAYASRLDACVILDFDEGDFDHMRLAVGQRLLSVNWYRWHSSEEPVEDLQVGPEAESNYVNVQPVIAETVCEDREAIEALQEQIPAERWKRAEQCAMEAFERAGEHARSGNPTSSWMTARERS